MKFDPIRNRQNKLKEDGSFLRYLLAQQYDQNKPMGNVAQYHLGDAISYWLIGIHIEIEPIIHRSNFWLDKAINGDEKFGGNHNFHRTLLHWARAMGTWLEDAANDEGHWDQARVYEEAVWRFEGRPWPRNEIIKSGLDDYMAFAYQGGKHDDGFEAGIDMYQHWLGEKPLSLKKVLKPREFGYARCLHRARGQFDENELFDAGKKMLQANLEEVWLGGGQYLRAATSLLGPRPGPVSVGDHTQSLRQHAQRTAPGLSLTNWWINRFSLHGDRSEKSLRKNNQADHSSLDGDADARPNFWMGSGRHDRP
ncbi:hypothetical protein [Rhizobium sp. AP16]|uniref:hypothetical protein n=1 Tax=Rhizobium sp. AP16 TaxID=1144306 RepID=UPI00026ECE8C|nr:hypothetical protein [Rhizobium sp. AP16]EJK79518.1 hypothetical protein PMI03_05480 [Rhizobium sp. AP16]